MNLNSDSHLCNALGYKRVYLTVNQYAKSGSAAFHSIARIAKNRYGECKGKMQNVHIRYLLLPIPYAMHTKFKSSLFRGITTKY